MFSGENYIPDLNFIDYSISVYPLSLGDRTFQFPTPCPDTFYTYEALQERDQFQESWLKEKSYFCSLVASYDNERNMRSKFLDKLSQYK